MNIEHTFVGEHHGLAIAIPHWYSVWIVWIRRNASAIERYSKSECPKVEEKGHSLRH